MALRHRLLFPQCIIGLSFGIEFFDIVSNDKSDIRLGATLLFILILIYFSMFIDFALSRIWRTFFHIKKH